MECKDIRGKLSAYLDDELSFEERNSVKGHLEICSSCSEEENRLVLVSSFLDNLPAEDISPFFTEKVVNSVISDLKSSRKFYLLKPALAGFAIIVILLFGIGEFIGIKTAESYRDEYLQDFGDFPPGSLSKVYMRSISREVR